MSDHFNLPPGGRPVPPSDFVVSGRPNQSKLLRPREQKTLFGHPDRRSPEDTTAGTGTAVFHPGPRRPETGSKAPGIVPGKVLFVRVFEIHIGSIRQHVRSQGGFAGLPEASDRHDGKPLQKGLDGGFRLPGYILALGAHLQLNCGLARNWAASMSEMIGISCWMRHGPDYWGCAATHFRRTGRDHYSRFTSLQSNDSSTD